MAKRIFQFKGEKRKHGFVWLWDKGTACRFAPSGGEKSHQTESKLQSKEFRLLDAPVGGWSKCKGENAESGTHRFPTRLCDGSRKKEEEEEKSSWRLFQTVIIQHLLS